MHFFVLIISTSPCFASSPSTNDAKKLSHQLQFLSHKIQQYQNNMDLIDREVATLEQDKDTLKKDIEKAYYSFLKMRHAYLSKSRTPLYLSFLGKNASVIDQYRHYRTQYAFQKMSQIIAEENIVRLSTLTNKIQSIQDYKHQLDLLSLTVSQSLLQIEELSKNKNAKSISAFHSIVSDLVNQEETLQNLITSLIKLPDITLDPIDHPETPLSFILPASGVISKNTSIETGISIMTRPNALITAPERGRVLYADTFRRHGKIIILNHGNSYVSMMRGFEKIFVETGDILEKNTPIGTLPFPQKTGTKSNGAMLYYELRYNGEVIDPLTLLSGTSN